MEDAVGYLVSTLRYLPFSLACVRVVDFDGVACFGHRVRELSGFKNVLGGHDILPDDAAGLSPLDLGASMADVGVLEPGYLAAQELDHGYRLPSAFQLGLRQPRDL